MNLSGTRAHCEADKLMRLGCADSIRARGNKMPHQRPDIWMQYSFCHERTFSLHRGANHICPRNSNIPVTGSDQAVSEDGQS